MNEKENKEQYDENNQHNPNELKNGGDEHTHNKSQSEYRLAHEKMWVLTLTYSIPTIVGMLVNALYNVVDRFWVGRIEGVGDAALTGIGICMPIMIVILGVCQLVGVGAATNISISLGKRDKANAEHVLGNALTLALLFNILITSFGLLYRKSILSAVGGTELTIPFALPYITIILFGCGFQMISFILNHPIRAAGNPMRFASTQVLGAVINMILDPIFIFKLNLGIKGAAYATIIAQFVSASWVLAYYFSKNAALRFRLKNLIPSFKIIMQTFSIGVSPFLMQIAASLISVLMNRSLLYYGGLELGQENQDIAIGAMTVIGSISTLIFMPLFGINQGTQPIIGYNYGRKDYKRVKSAYNYSVLYSLVISSIGFLGIQFFSRQLISMFNSNPLLVDVGANGMRIFLGAILIVGYQIPSANFFLSIGRAKTTIVLSLLRQVLLLTPLYLILPLFMGLNGIWYSGLLADIISTVVVAIVITKELRKYGAKEGTNGDNTTNLLRYEK